MKNYKKITVNGFILGVCIISGLGNIDEAEYNRLTEILSDAPEAPDGFYYKLREDETWELIEKEPEPTDPDLDDAELLSILLGGDSI